MMILYSLWFDDSFFSIIGVFVDNAMSLVHAPAWSFEKRSSYLETATQDALKYGLTSVHDAGATPDFIQVFQRCAHVSLMLWS